MTQPADAQPWTAERYFALESASEQKHEFWNGAVFAMAGGTPEHTLIAMNVGGALRDALRAGPCRVYGSDLKVFVPRSQGFVYPDVTVGCDGPRFHPDHPEVLVNPRLIVEVLSDSTERFDRGDKFVGYRTVPSLTDYVLVAQRERHVEHFAREHDGSWSLRDYGPGEVVAIASLEIALPADEVYFKAFVSGATSG